MTSQVIIIHFVHILLLSINYFIGICISTIDYLSKPVLVSDESVTRSGAVTSLDCLHSGLFDPSNGKLADPAMLAGYALGGLQWHRLSQSDFEFDAGNDMGMMIGGTLDPQLLYLEDDRAIAEGDDNAEQ